MTTVASLQPASGRSYGPLTASQPRSMPAPPPSFDSFPDAAPPAVEEPARKRRRLSPDVEEERRREKKEAKRRAKQDAAAEEARYQQPDSRPRSQTRDDQDPAEQFLSNLLPPRPSAASAPKPAPAKKPPDSPFPRQRKPSEQVPIIIDVAGDNRNFQGLESGKVPHFRRYGAGLVGGLNPKLRIPKAHNTSRKSLPTLPRHPNAYLRYTDKSVRRRVADDSFRRISIRTTSAPQPTEPEAFIAVDNPAKKEAEREEEEGPAYRTISTAISDSEDDDPLADDGLGGESHGERVLRRNAEFDKALKESPRNVQLWLAFAEYNAVQERKNVVPSEAETRAAADIKLAKLERALRVPGLERDERLQSARLRAAADLWTPKRLLEEWRLLLDAQPDSTTLWLEYATFRSSTGFTKDGTVEVYIECLTVLGDFAARATDENQRASLESNMIYLFLRLVTLLRHAGYSEQALAAFQALIELNLFRPPHLRYNERALAELEDFWDLESPRIGEEGAKGWCNTPADVMPPTRPPPSAAGQTDLSSAAGRWLAAEQAAHARASRPARSSDDGADVDPFSVVLFADIKPMLFIVWSSSALTELVYAFFAFLGVPFLPPDVPTSILSATDSFLRNELVDNAHARARFWPALVKESSRYDLVGQVAMEAERHSGLRDPFASPFKIFPITASELFVPGKSWFSFVEREDLAGVDVDLVRNAFAQLQSQSPDHSFALNALCLEALVKPKNAAKLAKSFVAADQKNISLYEGYARFEQSRGNLDKARMVYAQALSDLGSQPEARSAWFAWAELEWQAGRSPVALEILHASVSPSGQAKLASLASSAESKPSGPDRMQELRTRKAFNNLLEDAQQRVAVVSSLALFEYLTKGLQAACDTFEAHVSTFAQGDPASFESFWTAYAKLLYRHSSSRAEYRPIGLRDVLERALSHFPANSIFASLYAWNESRMRIQNRVRTLFEGQLGKDETATAPAWLFRIYVELNMQANLFSVHAVRNLFERAAISLRSAPSLAIWSLYVEFETRYGELRNAKAVLVRAIQQCPWAKELYLMAFVAPLSSAYTNSELRDMHTLMKEFGLRIHVDIESYLAEEGASEAPQLRIADSRADWEVAELAEREASKPYR